MASPDYSDGCMIALYPPQQLADDLAVADGLSPADMHVTVAYLGTIADVDRDSLIATAQALSARRPIEATVSGHARFTGGDKDVIVALVDSADLEDLRCDAVNELGDRDVAIPRDHGYTPHLTITYIGQDDGAPVDRIAAQPATFSTVSAVYGTERTDFRFLLTETAQPRVTAETATLQLGDLKGIWRPVYAHRTALHTTADAIILAAWKRDAADLNLADALADWNRPAGETVDTHRRQAAAAAVLIALQAHPWKRTLAAIATAAKRAHRIGWAAGRALLTRDQGDDTPYDDNPDSGYGIGAPDMPDATADGTATAVLSTALAATANRAGRALADSADDLGDDGEGDAEDVVHDGYDMSLAADVAVSTAYGAGLLAAYLDTGVQGVAWVTAGDGAVCVRCSINEDNGPYSPFATPSLPAHPRCRCVLAPA